MKLTGSRLVLLLWMATLLTFNALPAASQDSRPGPNQGPALTPDHLAAALKSIPGGEADQTLSPFFFVASDDPELDRLPLKSSRAKVRIDGIMAQVTLTQTYQNQGRRTLEAIYLFPASTRAAVHRLTMTVGERTIKAQIMERGKARETYEQARQSGQTASLLEQQRPNVFQMNLANILPGDEIRVELEYTELIVPDEGTYRFVLPTVVGPRFSARPAAGAGPDKSWVENPYLHQGEPPTYDFGLEVELAAGLPLAGLTSPSHRIKADFQAKDQARLEIENDSLAGTRDFILDYRLAGERVLSGLLLQPGREENHFLLLLEPPAQVTPREILPREYIFIVDVSGSMRGFPLEVSKTLINRMVGDLKPNEAFNLLLFAGGSAVLSPEGSLPATPANKEKALAWLGQHRGGGGTRLLPALKTALALPRQEGLSRVVTVVTDGYVDVEPEAFELVRANLGQANLFAFGIGRSVNRFLIEGLARVGGGEPRVVLGPGQAGEAAERFRRYIDSPVLTGIQVAFEGFEAYEVEPQAVGDLFGRKPVVVFGKYRGPAQGRIVVSGLTAAGRFQQSLEADRATVTSQSRALELLWARARIGRLSDLNRLRPDDERAAQVTQLGLKHSLLTAYTSFVAVDQVKRADGEVVTVKQPLPLPSGVSDAAVGRAGAMATFKMAPRPGISPEAAPVQADTGVREEAAKPRLSVRIIEIIGQADRKALKLALEAGKKDLESCFSLGRSLAGRYRLVLSLDQKGEVKLLVLTSPGPVPPDLAECLKGALSRLGLPRPESGSIKLVLELVMTSV